MSDAELVQTAYQQHMLLILAQFFDEQLIDPMVLNVYYARKRNHGTRYGVRTPDQFKQSIEVLRRARDKALEMVACDEPPQQGYGALE